MKPTTWGMVGIAAVIAVVSARGIGADQGNSAGKRRGCSDATIRGTYGIQISGTRPAGPDAVESVIGVVIRHYDGRGQFTQVDNVKGSITGIVPDREGFGTYEVNADCSGVSRLEPGPGILLEERMVIVNGGREIRTVTTLPPPVMVSGVHLRIDD